MLLAGDIGGTKTVLALISMEMGVRQPIREATFPSTDYRSLVDIVKKFIIDVDIDLITHACFGVAGPVIEGEAKITNLPWIIKASEIEDTFEIKRAHLLNDLESIAYAIPHLVSEDLVTINQGVLEPTGTIAVIAPGTGLGQAFLTWHDDQYLAHPSEGGHASFAPTTSLQQEMLSYLIDRFGHVSVERVCSGSGIPNIFRFLRDSGRYDEPAWLAEQLSSVEDITPLIAKAAHGNQAGICAATMNLFVDVLADEASNLALKVLATGGVYIGGGIPPRILDRLQAPRFMELFADKGRFSDLLANLPIHVIRNPKAALYGAAHYGLEH